MNLSKMTLCTQDLRKQSAELMRCVDNVRVEHHKIDTMLVYHIKFNISADGRAYTTHTQVRSCNSGREDDKVISEITSHARDLDSCENTVNALLAVPCTPKTRVYVACVKSGSETVLPVETQQMRYGDSTDMQTLQCDFAMLHDGYDHLILTAQMPEKQTVRFMVQLNQTLHRENVEALLDKARQSTHILGNLQTKVDTLMKCTQPLTKLIQRNFVQTSDAARIKLETLRDTLTQMDAELSQSDAHSSDTDLVSLLTASENIDWQKSWEVKGISQPRMLRHGQSVHNLLRELSDDAVENAIKLLCLKEDEEQNVQTLLQDRCVLCECLQEPRRELSEVVNRRAMWVTLGAIDDVLRQIVTNKEVVFGTYLPYHRYAFELRQMAHYNDTNSEKLSDTCFDRCMQTIELGKAVVDSVRANPNTSLLTFDMPMVQCVCEGVLLRGLTSDHAIAPAHGQLHEYATQNVYDLQKHDNVTALNVLRSNLSAEDFENRKQAVTMLTAMLLRDENHRIISRNLSKLALDCLLHASTSSASALQQQQVLDVLCVPAKQIMLQALGLETGLPSVEFLKDEAMVSMYDAEKRNELQLMLLVNRV